MMGMTCICISMCEMIYLRVPPCHRDGGDEYCSTIIVITATFAEMPLENYC